MGLARRIHSLRTRLALGATVDGRRALAVLNGSPADLPGDSSELPPTIDRALAGGVLKPRALESRIRALRAQQPRLADALLDRAIAVRRGQAGLVEIKFDALHAAQDRDAVLAFSRAIVDDGDRPPAALLKTIAMLDRAGVAHDDPTMAAALGQYRRATARQGNLAIAEAALLRALGLSSHAVALLRDAIAETADRTALVEALARMTLRQDLWNNDQPHVEAALQAGMRIDRQSVEARTAARRSAAAAIANPAFAVLEPDPEGAILARPPVAALESLLANPPASYTTENRLLMVGNSLGGGGMERVMAESYRHFADGDSFDRVDLALLEYAGEGPRAFYRDLAGVEAGDIVLLPRGGESRPPISHLPGVWRARAQPLHDHIAATRPRVIHAWNDLTGLLAAFAGIAAGAPRIVAHFHHLPDVPLAGRTREIAAYPACYRMLLARPEMRFLFCSEAAADGYADWWSVERDARFRVARNGIALVVADPEKGRAVRAALGVPADAPLIGTVFRFDPVKQPLLWADTAIALAAARPEAHFLMVGDGPLAASVAARFAEAGLVGRAHLVGRVSNVADHLAAMDLFWLTSRTEGLPTAIVEAQMAGVPVIAFDSGGVPETIAPGVTGRLAAPGDIAGLRDASLAALADPEWRAAAAARGPRIARERFSQARFLASLVQVYDG